MNHIDGRRRGRLQNQGLAVDPEFYTCRTRRLQSFHGAHSLTLQLVLTGAD